MHWSIILAIIKKKKKNCFDVWFITLRTSVSFRFSESLKKKCKRSEQYSKDATLCQLSVTGTLNNYMVLNTDKMQSEP